MRKYSYIDCMDIYQINEQREAKRAYRRKHYAENRERYKAKAHSRKCRPENRERYKASMRKCKANDTNSSGMTKHKIRKRSRVILSRTHSLLKDYEVHHCFGYDDPNKFIYIPKTLHLQIHQLLRDSNISADSDHWNAIRDLVNSCEEYTYIRT